MVTTVTSSTAAKAWYISYPSDAYALGPYRFGELVTADIISDMALSQFGERPAEIWAAFEGPNSSREVEEYEYEVSV